MPRGYHGVIRVRPLSPQPRRSHTETILGRETRSPQRRPRSVCSRAGQRPAMWRGDETAATSQQVVARLVAAVCLPSAALRAAREQTVAAALFSCRGCAGSCLCVSLRSLCLCVPLPFWSLVSVTHAKRHGRIDPLHAAQRGSPVRLTTGERTCRIPRLPANRCCQWRRGGPQTTKALTKLTGPPSVPPVLSSTPARAPLFICTSQP